MKEFKDESILFPILAAVVLPIFIGLFLPGALDFVRALLHWSAFLAAPIVVFGKVYSWANSDDTVFRIAGRS